MVKNMKLKFLLIRTMLASLYIVLIFVGVFFNYNLKPSVPEEYSEDINKKLATLVDSKGHFLVYNRKKYEAWVDLDFMKRRNKYRDLKYVLNQRFSDKELEEKKYIKWGFYDTYKEAVDDLGYLKRFSNIHTINDRIYNDLFSYSQLIGKIDKTEYGIEPYLYENNILQGKEKIKLSLDTNLQKFLYDSLNEVVKERQADGAVAIIMETKTGKIKASVSLYPWNMGYMGYIEPGSTLKPMLYAIALDEQIIRIDDVYTSDYAYYPVPGINFKVTESVHYGYGDLTIKEALIRSSNVIIAKVINESLKEFSNEWLYNEILKMGFGEKTGIEFKGEINGIFQSPYDWYPITPYQIAMGQGLGTTPIQLVTAFNAIVNDGYIVKPSFLQDKEIEKRLIFTPQSSKILKEWMSYITISGTARLAYKEGLIIGGKTGTAQKAIKGEGYTDEDYYSLFAGFYPVSNPKYTIALIVDSPKDEYYGGEVAAPIVTKIFYEYEKSLGESFEYTDTLYKNIIPEFKNYRLEEAYNILMNFGYKENKIIIHGNGEKIIKQFPNSGKTINTEEYIELFTE